MRRGRTKPHDVSKGAMNHELSQTTALTDAELRSALADALDRFILQKTAPDDQN